jgi:hypothetical protein
MTDEIGAASLAAQQAVSVAEAIVRGHELLEVADRVAAAVPCPWCQEQHHVNWPAPATMVWAWCSRSARPYTIDPATLDTDRAPR